MFAHRIGSSFALPASGPREPDRDDQSGFCGFYAKELRPRPRRREEFPQPTCGDDRLALSC
jgi:hypothetical protein